MFDSRNRCFLITVLVLSLALPVFAEDHCSVKAVIGGTPATLKYCAVALYESENSVTLLFSESAFTQGQLEDFQESSAPPEKDAAGKRPTAIHFSFCPGGGKPLLDPASVKLVEMSVTVASSPFLGFQSTYELPKDKSIVNIEKLSGDLKLGGRLTGRISGGRMSDGKKYSWEADFDLKLPAKAAFGGQGCN